MANLVELNRKVEESHITKPEIARVLGITANSLRNKLAGRTDFKVCEMQSLSKLLHLSITDTISIFLR